MESNADALLDDSEAFAHGQSHRDEAQRRWEVVDMATVLYPTELVDHEAVGDRPG